MTPDTPLCASYGPCTCRPATGHHSDPLSALSDESVNAMAEHYRAWLETHNDAASVRASRWYEYELARRKAAADG